MVIYHSLLVLLRETTAQKRKEKKKVWNRIRVKKTGPFLCVGSRIYVCVYCVVRVCVCVCVCLCVCVCVFFLFFSFLFIMSPRGRVKEQGKRGQSWRES